MVQKFLGPRKAHISSKETICTTHSSDFPPCCLYLPGDFFLYPVRKNNTYLALVGKGQLTSKKCAVENNAALIRALRKPSVCWEDQVSAVEGGSPPERDRSGDPFPKEKQEEPNVAWSLGTKATTRSSQQKHVMVLFHYFKGIGGL